MTPEVAERAQEIAVAEWGSDWHKLPESMRFNIVRRAVEDVRDRKLQAAIRAARGQSEEQGTIRWDQKSNH